MNKKIFTLDDLCSFYSTRKRSTTFSSEKSGYQLSVLVPASFEVYEENNDDTLLFCKVKLMHSGENRNHSSVTDDALKKAAKTLAYKPILANFMEYEDSDTGELLKDFTSHDMELNDDGSITYLESQIGCFTSDEPYFEVEEESGHNFLYAYCAIPRSYSDACSIIERKGGTKVSVELLVNEMTYNAKSHVLELTDVLITGATCLGKNPNNMSDIEEGMKGARLDIASFKAKNNSIFENFDLQMIDFQERLKKLEATCFNIPQENFEKGGSENNNMNKFEELLNKYNKTAEEITFEHEGLTDEELEAKFAEVFDQENESAEGEEGQTPEVPVVEEKKDDENEPDDPDEPDDTSDDDDNDDDEKKFAKTFELSHEDIRSALYVLLEPIEQAMNDWFWIVEVYDSHFICQSCTGKYYSQKYTKDNDTVALDGELVEVYAEFVTASEKEELDKMRANYSSIVDKPSKYEEEEDIADKMTIFSDEAYADFLETDEFKNLMSRETMKKFTKDELAGKADAAYGKLIRTTKTFAAVPTEPEEKPQEKKPMFYAFSKHEEKSSFLDGLLNSKN